MTTEKLILADCDGVLLNWEEHYHNFMRYRGHDRVNDPDHNTYWIEKQYSGLSLQEARRTVEHFNTSSWMISLPAFRDARIGVARLVNAGYQFHVITAMGLDPYSKQLREINLERVFGADAIAELTVTDMVDSDSKRASLSQYKDSGLPWIEDKWSNAVLGADLGLRSIVIDHAHNRENSDDRIERVSDWNELCGLLLT